MMHSSKFVMRWQHRTSIFVILTLFCQYFFVPASVPVQAETRFQEASIRTPVTSPSPPIPSDVPGSLHAQAAITSPSTLAFDPTTLPVSFVPNRGQSDPAVLFQSYGVGGSVFLTSDEVVLAIPVHEETLATNTTSKARSGASSPQTDHLPTITHPITQTFQRLAISLIDAHAQPMLRGVDLLPGSANYLLGSEPNEWQTGLPSYAGVLYEGIYSGIDLRYDGSDGALKSTYYVAPYADPSQIQWQYTGAEHVTLSDDGSLSITLTDGDQQSQTPIQIHEEAPLAWQIIDGVHTPVRVAYSIRDDSTIQFVLDAYDPSHELIIDPTLTYNVIIGAPGTERGYGVTADADGNTYIVADTANSAFPVTSPTPYAGGGDVLVLKLNPSGTQILYGTYIGGSSSDQGRAIVVDSDGRVSLTGTTFSSDFPTHLAQQSSFGGGDSDAFVATLSADGTRLLHSTYFGGSGLELGYDIALDPTNEQAVAIIGITESSDYPTTSGAYDTSCSNCSTSAKAFVTHLAVGDSATHFSTYLGGENRGTQGHTITFDESGALYAAGQTLTDDFPTTPGAYDTSYAASFPIIRWDAFITKFNASGSDLIYSTYLGGDHDDCEVTLDSRDCSIVVDSSGALYITGTTYSSDFPTLNAYQSAAGGNGDIFVSKLNSSGSALEWSTYLGGAQQDSGRGIAVSGDTVTIVGGSLSSDFPTSDPLQASLNGSMDMVVAQLSAASGSLSFSSYLGTSQYELANDVATNGRLGNVYLVGGQSNGGVSNIVATKFGPGSGGLPGDQAFCPLCIVSQASVGGPINTRTGNVWTSATDLTVASRGASLTWQRSYASQATEDPSGPLGAGWSHPYAARILTTTLEPDVVIVVSPLGNRERFTDLGGGAFQAYPGIFSSLVFDGAVYTQTLQNQSHLIFNTQGQLTRLIDEQGYELVLGYTGVPSRLTRIGDTLTSARALTLTYSGDFIRSVSDGIRTVQYSYTIGDLTEALDVMGRPTTYHYTNHLLTGIDNALGQPLERTLYDGTIASSKAISQTLLDGRTIQLEYTSGSTVVTTTTSLGERQVETFFYDWDNTLIGTEVNNESVTASAFTSDFQPATLVDGNNNATRITYSESNLPTTVTSAEGTQMRMRYDSANRPISTTNALDITSLFRYDSYGNVISTTVGITTSSLLRATTLYTYTAPTALHPSGLLQEQSGPDGLVTRYSYTADGQPASVTVGYGTTLPQTTVYGYDLLGRVITTTIGVGTLFERQDVTRYRADNSIAERIQNYKDGLFDPAHPDEDIITSYGYDLLGRTVVVTDTLGTVTASHYNAQGRIDWSIRNLTPLHLDLSGQPVFQAFSPSTPDANVATLYGYDGLGRTTLVTETGILTGTFNLASKTFSDVTQRVTRTQYDALSRPVTVTLNYRPELPSDTYPDVNLQIITYYDGASNPIWQRDTWGRWSKTQYDALNRPITVTLNFENGDPLTVDPLNEQELLTDTDLIQVTRYDALGRVVEQIENYVDGVFSITEPTVDRITRYEYDTLGRRTATTNNYDPSTLGTRPDTNQTTRVAYDPITLRLVGSQDPLGRWVNTNYDSLGRATSRILNCSISGIPSTSGCDTFDPDKPDRNVPSLTNYDALNRPAGLINALGVESRSFYDGLGRTIATIDHYDDGLFDPLVPDTDVTASQQYDALGRTLVITDALGIASYRAYNALGLTVVITDSAGRISRQGYDGTGAPRWSQAPDGTTSVSLVDGLGRVTTTIANYEDGIVAPSEPVDQDVIAQTVYDRAGRTVATIDPAGFETRFAYDVMDRLIGVTENAQDEGCRLDPCNVITHYTYDRAGNRIAITDARGYTRTFTYDAAGNQITATDALGQTTAWSYDQLGRVTFQDDPRGSDFDLTYHYDGVDRITETLSLELEAPIQTTYDALGRRLSLTDGTGTTHFDYDALGRITEVDAPTTGMVGYAYNARGQRTELTYPDTSSLSYTYTNDGKLSQVLQASTALATYGYDSVGRLETLARANGADTSYSYDALGRISALTTEDASDLVSSFHYTYDRRGLRTQVDESLPIAPPTAEPTVTHTPTITGSPTATATASETATHTPTPLPIGTGLLASYFDDPDFTELHARRVDPVIDFWWGEGAPIESMDGDSFSIRWEGTLLPPVSGTYLFKTTADDAERLIINGQTLIDDWGSPTGNPLQETLVLTAGIAVPIQVLFREDTGDAGIIVEWSRPDLGGWEPLPSSALFPATTPSGSNGTGTGLQGLYYANDSFSGDSVVALVDPVVAFTWADGAPSIHLDPDEFSARWTGTLLPRFSEVYTFTVLADGGARLVVDNQELFSDLSAPTYGLQKGTIALSAGQPISITVEFSETADDASLLLWWASPNQVFEFIPQSQLFPPAGAPIRITPSPTPTLPSTGLLGSYYNGETFSDLRVRQVDQTVDMDWGGQAPDPDMDVDSFTARWEGELVPPSTGIYTFQTQADNREQLSVNGMVLIDDWASPTLDPITNTISLTAGITVPIVLRYQEDGDDAFVRLQWTPPGEEDPVVVPASVLRPAAPPTAIAGNGYGLHGEYYLSPDLSGTPALVRTDPQIAFDWRSGGPSALVENHAFSVRWSGSIRARYTGVYTFTLLSDDGARLVIDTHELINDLEEPNYTAQSGTIALVAGQAYPILVEYQDEFGDAHIRLWWSSPDQVRELVPQLQLELPTSGTPTPSVSVTPTATGSVSPTPTSTSTGETVTPTFTPTTTATSTASPTLSPTATSGVSTRLKEVTFEDGSLTHVSTGVDTTVINVGTLAITSTGALQGSYAAQLTSGASTYLQENVTATDDLFVTFLLRLDSTPASGASLLRIYNGSSQVGNLFLNMSRQLLLRQDGTQIGSASTALTTGTTYRIGIRQSRGSGDGVLEAFVVTGNSAFGSAFASSSSLSITSAATRLNLGAPGSSGSLSLTIDDLVLDTGSMPEPLSGGSPTATATATASPTPSATPSSTATSTTRLKDATFEDGSLTHSVTGIDTAVINSGTLTIISSSTLRGDYSAQLYEGASTYLQEDISASDDLFVSFLVRLDAAPSSGASLLRIYNGGSQVGNLYLNSGRQLLLRQDGTQIGSASSTLAINTTYRVGIRQSRGSGTGVLEAFVVAGNSAFSSAFASSSSQTISSAATRINIGAPGSSGSLSLTLDDIAFDTSNMPGPLSDGSSLRANTGAATWTLFLPAVSGAPQSRAAEQRAPGISSLATLTQFTRTISYTYDGLQRLTSANESPGKHYTYAYDLAGNLIQSGEDGQIDYRSYNAANQVVGWSYDAAGNLLNDGAGAYSYDALNRLVEQDSTSLHYNGDGVLVQEGTTFYTQDLVSPLTHVLNDGTSNYLYGYERLASSSGDWYLNDAIGSLRVTLDDTGDLLGGQFFDPFGVPQSQLVTPFGFTGELQQQSGMTYLRARWYSAANGTFTSRDPFAGFDQRPYSLHPYQYAYSAPSVFTDPSGEAAPALIAGLTLAEIAFLVAAGYISMAMLNACVQQGICQPILDASKIYNTSVNVATNAPKGLDYILHGGEGYVWTGGQVPPPPAPYPGGTSLRQPQLEDFIFANPLSSFNDCVVLPFPVLQQQAPYLSPFPMLSGQGPTVLQLEVVNPDPPDYDPLAKYGPARLTHPEEYEQSLAILSAAGVTIKYRTGALAYSSLEGRPGELLFDPEASIGALRHEMQHFYDDKANGYKSMGYYMANWELFIEHERRGYQLEIDYAISIGDQSTAQQLRDTFSDRMNKIMDRYRGEE